MGKKHAKYLARVAVVVAFGCTGDIGTPSRLSVDDTVPTGAGGADRGAVNGVTPAVNGATPGANTPAGTAAAAIMPLRCTTKAVGPSPLRRLTHTEYNNSVADLLGDTTHPANDFPADTQVGLFDNTASAQTVPSLLADQYLDSATTLATNIKDVNALVGCDPAAKTGSDCMRTFVQRFGRRAFRRPLTSTELNDFVTLFGDTTLAADAATGARTVIASILASPNFLFRPEFGTGNATTLPKAKLASPFELASRLASLLWASVPDDTLLDAAANGQLNTGAQVATQARRMLMDPKAKAAVAAFYDQWLGLAMLDSATKDKTLYPQFDDALRSSMAEETRRFISYVVWNDDAKLSTLLTASYSFVNQPLGKLYGVAGGNDVATYTKTQLDPSQRMGLLTQASLMTAFASPVGSSPIKRGKLVRVRLLCQDLPDPPANVPPPAPPQPGVSTRERFAMHTDNVACSGCHHLIDGLGFGLEHYDGVGGFRMLDQGVQVDATGEVNTTEDIDGPFDGGLELARRLSGSAQVRDCAPTQWLRYALARRETDDDTCSLVSLRDSFAASGGNLRDLMVALTQTDAFLNYRQPE